MNIMGLWKKGFERNNNGSVRLEDDRADLIDEFFASQGQVISYEIVDKTNWVVNVDGSIHLYDDDLDDGVLFFKIGKLTGSLYCHCRYVSPSVIPVDMEGEIVFVPDEEINRTIHMSDSVDELPLDMGMITAEPKEYKVRQSIQSALSHLIENSYDIDIESIISKIKDEKENVDKYQLKMIAEPAKRGYVCNFYITRNGEDSLIDMTSIQKTVYMLFIIKEDGYIVDYITPEFTNSSFGFRN